MVFEDMIKKTRYKATDRPITRVRTDLEPKRNNNIEIIQYVFKNEVLGLNKQFGKDKIIKLAIDNLVNDLNNLDNETKQLEYIKTLYKEAIF